MRSRYIFRFFAVLLFILKYSDALAQDVIIRTNNDTIRAKVLEITVDKIKFRYNDAKKGPVLEITKNQVKEIIYENGSKLTIVYNAYEVSPDLMIRVRYHALKADIIAPFLNHITIAYEVKLKVGRNLEIKASYIHPYVTHSLKRAEGYFVKGGMKFIKCVTSYHKGLKYIDPLWGSYFKPEIIFGQFISYEDDYNVTCFNYGADILFGKQSVLWKIITVDYCMGFGYGLQAIYYDKSKAKNKREDFNYAYSHLFFGKKLPIIITGGVTVGVLLK